MYYSISRTLPPRSNHRALSIRSRENILKSIAPITLFVFFYVKNFRCTIFSVFFCVGEKLLTLYQIIIKDANGILQPENEQRDRGVKR